eukprot:6471359-Amphidinium_carterae.2
MELPSLLAAHCSWVSHPESLLGSALNWIGLFADKLQVDACIATGIALKLLVSGAIPTFVLFLLRRLMAEDKLQAKLSDELQWSPLTASLSSWFPHHVRGPSRSRRAHRSFQLSVATFNAKSLLEAGKLVFFAKQLDSADIDVVCVQETRFRDAHLIEKVQNFRICSVAAEQHRGGLMVLVRDRPGLSILEHEHVSNRVLRVSFRANSLLVHVISAHAPTEESCEDEHASFAVSMEAAIRKVSHTGRLIVGCDLNAKLGGLDMELIGPLALSCCKNLAAHRRPLLDFLSSQELRASNTFMGPSDGLTWRHPTGYLAQIDFIFVSPEVWSSTTSVRVEEWGLFDLETASDHRMVTLFMDLGCKQTTAGTRLAGCRKFVSDEHLQAFAGKWKSSYIQPWDPSQSVPDYLGCLMQEAANVLDATKPKASPKKPWIGERAWNFMFVLNKYRRLLAALYDGDRCRSTRIAREIVFHQGECFFPMEETNAIDGCRAAIKVLGNMTKRLLRADRKAWIGRWPNKFMVKPKPRKPGVSIVPFGKCASPQVTAPGGGCAMRKVWWSLISSHWRASGSVIGRITSALFPAQQLALKIARSWSLMTFLLRYQVQKRLKVTTLCSLKPMFWQS